MRCSRNGSHPSTLLSRTLKIECRRLEKHHRNDESTYIPSHSLYRNGARPSLPREYPSIDNALEWLHCAKMYHFRFHTATTTQRMPPFRTPTKRLCIRLESLAAKHQYMIRSSPLATPRSKRAGYVALHRRSALCTSAARLQTVRSHVLYAG